MCTDIPDLSRDGFPLCPASERNKHAILDCLRHYLTMRCDLLEVASGFGQHALHMAQALPQVRWQTSEQASAIEVLCQRAAQHPLSNIPPPIILDAADTATWPDRLYDAVFTANSFHIMPWSSVANLLHGVRKLLRSQGLFFVYGPFFSSDVPPEPSNQAFDASLRKQNPQMGIRDLAQVKHAANQAGMKMLHEHAMPANNRFLVFVLQYSEPDVR